HYARGGGRGGPAAYMVPGLAVLTGLEAVRRPIVELLAFDRDVGRAGMNGATPIWYTRPSMSLVDPGKWPDTLLHVFPPSRVTCTSPSSVPTQITLESVGARLTVRIV